MGSYAQLAVGEWDVASYKSALPLEALLMFRKLDLEVIGPDKRLEDSTFRFVTTAGAARRRLDEHGLDLASCRSLFADLRSPKLFQYEPEDGSFRGKYVDNHVNFETYLTTIRDEYVHDTATEGFASPPDNRPRQEKLRRLVVFGDDFFRTDASLYFADVTQCIFLRCLLEAVPNDELVTLDITELVLGGWIEAGDASDIFESHLRIIRRRIELDYRLYGFVIEEDPVFDARLRKVISEMDEDALIAHVVMPLLERLGLESLRAVTHHGAGEFGADVRPFRQPTPFGTYEYGAVQVKAVPIHGTSSRQGNAAEVVSQANQAFSVTFLDDIDNERKRIDRFIVITNKLVTPSARLFIENALDGRRQIMFFDIDRLIELVKARRLAQYVLFADLTS